jgi:hypothetical protein
MSEVDLPVPQSSTPMGAASQIVQERIGHVRAFGQIVWDCHSDHREESAGVCHSHNSVISTEVERFCLIHAW